MRPDRLVLVAGTSTGLGKTSVAASLASRLRARGVGVSARKLAQSGDAGTGPTDAEVLAAATGETPEQVCPRHRWYPVAMAPPMAAEALGLPPFTVADLVGELAWPEPPVAVGLVETAGGVGSPQAVDGDVVDLAHVLRPGLVLLVADAGLGTISAVRLAAGALVAAGVPITVVLNQFDPDNDLHRRNSAWLADRDSLTVVAFPGEEGTLVDAVAGPA